MDEKLETLASLIDDTTGGCFYPTVVRPPIKFQTIFLPTRQYSVLCIDNQGNACIYTEPESYDKFRCLKAE